MTSDLCQNDSHGTFQVQKYMFSTLCKYKKLDIQIIKSDLIHYPHTRFLGLRLDSHLVLCFVSEINTKKLTIQNGGNSAMFL